MNRSLHTTAVAALLSLSGALWAQDPFTFETAERLWSVGDFNNDGRSDAVILDRATGAWTMGFQDAAGTGNYVWGDAQPTGVMQATGLAVGRVNGSDALAVTAPSAGRVVLASQASPTAAVQTSALFPAMPESRAVGFFNTDATGDAELLVAGDQGATVPARYRIQMLQNLASTPAEQWLLSFLVPTTRVASVRVKTGQPMRLAQYAGSDFWVGGVSTTGLLGVPGARTGAVLNAATTQFALTSLDGGALSHFLFYDVGGTGLRIARITEPTAGSYGWTAMSFSVLPKAVKCIVPIPKTGGGSRLAFLFTDGTAGLYDFTGTGTPTLYANLGTGPGADAIFPGATDQAIVMRNGQWERWVMGASAPSSAAATGAAVLPRAASGVSNVLFLTAEPFANANAAIVGTGHVREWTTQASGSATNWTITSLVPTGASGLGGPATGQATGPNSTTAVLINQVRSDVSISFTGGLQGQDRGDLSLSPPSGIYPPAERAPGAGAPAYWVPGPASPALPASLLYDPDPANSTNPLVPIPPALRVNIAPTKSNATTFFRVNGGAWTQLTRPGEIDLYAFATIDAYAMSGTNRSPLRSATYTFAAPFPLAAPAFIDTDTDGLPDDWEKTFNLTDPNADADADGASNLAEYQAKTDPRDRAVAPTTGGGPVLAVKSTTTPNPNAFTLTWAASDPTIVLEGSQNLALASWTQITTGITTVGGNKEFTVTMNPTPNPVFKFYRLRKL